MLSTCDPPESYLERARVLLALGCIDDAKLVVQSCLKAHIGHRPALALMRELRQHASSSPPAHQDEPDASSWSSGRVLFDDLTLISPLGEGGMGQVLLARSKNLGRSFAVKTILSSKLALYDHHVMFFRELQTWIDLPEHPHLVACRFFRTLDDRVAIFADAVEGGTLKDWIERGQPRDVLTILDVAIQIAWGLEVAHDAGVVHQDIKPANVLMSRDGHARVTDFGLARARPLSVHVSGDLASRPTSPASFGSSSTPVTLATPTPSGVPISPISPMSPASPVSLAPPDVPGAPLRKTGRISLVKSAAGLTPAYCSPEQAAQLPLDFTTDLWSWGLVVLEMFAGRLPCLFGADARHALDVLTMAIDLRVEMPPEVVDMLARCFEHDPADRWASVAEATVRLQEIFAQIAGHPHERPMPSHEPDSEPTGPGQNEGVDARGGHAASEERSSKSHPELERSQRGWDDPTDWEATVAEALSQLPRPRGETVPARSRQSQAIADLARYDDLVHRLEPLLAAGSSEHEGLLARIWNAKSKVHQAAGDLSGWLDGTSRCRALYESLVETAQGDLRMELADAILCEGHALAARGNVPGVLASCDRAIELFEKLREENPETRTDLLARAYLSKADALAGLGHDRDALDAVEQCLVILERFLEDTERPDRFENVSSAWIFKGLLLARLDRFREALPLLLRSVEVREPLIEEHGRDDLVESLARTYLGMSWTLDSLGQPREAASALDRAIVLLERRVYQHHRREQVDALADAYSDKAARLVKLGDVDEAQALFNKCIALWERLVVLEGRGDRAGDLALALHNKSVMLFERGDGPQALELLDKSIALWGRQWRHESNEMAADRLALSYRTKANIVFGMGQQRESVDLCNRGIALWEELARNGQGELRDEIAVCCVSKAFYLSEMGDDLEAIAVLDTCIVTLEELVDEGRSDVLAELARSFQNKSHALGHLGRHDEALSCCDRSVAILEPLADGEGIAMGLVLAGALVDRARHLVSLGHLGRAHDDAKAAIEILEADGSGSVRPRTVNSEELDQEARRILVMCAHPSGGPELPEKALRHTLRRRGFHVDHLVVRAHSHRR